MQECMKDYPELYEKENEGGKSELEEVLEQETESESNKDSVPISKDASDANSSVEQPNDKGNW